MISPLGVNASLRALEGLSAGDAAQRIAHLAATWNSWSTRLKKLSSNTTAVDARNRLVASELERRWNEKLENIAKLPSRDWPKP